MKNYHVLAKSINFKLNFVAVHMNKFMHENYGYTYDTYDKKTWPYYLNISGEKHLLNTDVYVFSIDTSSNVLMSKTFREDHPATYELLMRYGKEYNDLVAEYVTQEGYIRGMLNPIDIDTAINAEDGDILFYNKKLVEWNESSLIPRISEAIKLYLERWLITEYIFTDNMYAPALYAQIVALISTTIYAQRHTAINTHELTFFYQSQLLESHMGIYAPEGLLDKEAHLWIAKNARYIATNVGKEKIFNLLIEKVLEPSGYYVTEVRISPTRYISTINEPGDSTFKKRRSVLYKTLKRDGDFQHYPVPLSEVMYKIRLLNDTADIFVENSILFNRMEYILYEFTAYRERSKVYEIHSKRKYTHTDIVSTEMVLEATLNYLATHDGMYQISTSTSESQSYNSKELMYKILGHLFKHYGLDLSTVLKTLTFNLPLHGEEVCHPLPSAFPDINFETDIIDELRTKLFSTEPKDIKEYISRIVEVERQFVCISTNNNSPYSTSILEHNYMYGLAPLVVDINSEDKSMEVLLEELPTSIVTEKIDHMKEIAIIIEQLTGYQDVNDLIYDSLHLIYKFIIRLTSYTITPMLDDTVINAVVSRDDVNLITDITVICIHEAEWQCAGAVPKVTMYGDDQINEIKAFDNKDLYISPADNDHIPLVIIGENYNDRIRAMKINITVT